MAIEDRVSTGVEWPKLTEFKRYGSLLLRWGIVTAAVLVWVLFWSLVVRLHIQLGNLVSAGIVSGLVVLPVALGYAYSLRLKLPNN